MRSPSAELHRSAGGGAAQPRCAAPGDESVGGPVGGDRRARVRSERGSTTAELAVALPAVALVLAACLAAVMLVAQQVRLTDAAADAARSLGRGESNAEAQAIAARVAGGGVRLAAVVDDAFVCATLRAPGAGLLGGVELSASSCAVSGGR